MTETKATQPKKAVATDEANADSSDSSSSGTGVLIATPQLIDRFMVGDLEVTNTPKEFSEADAKKIREAVKQMRSWVLAVDEPVDGKKNKGGDA